MKACSDSSPVEPCFNTIPMVQVHKVIQGYVSQQW